MRRVRRMPQTINNTVVQISSPNNTRPNRFEDAVLNVLYLDERSTGRRHHLASSLTGKTKKAA
jgi:hypothetical protein